MLSAVALLSLVAVGPRHPLPPPAVGDPDDVRAVVRVDSARHEVVVTIGPYLVAAMPPGVSHEMMEMEGGHDTPLIRFQWPVDGWMRGFSIEIVGKGGRPIDRRLLHHLIGVNFDRRQLLYPAFERIFGAGQETEAAFVPKTIGVPMSAGARLGMYMAWSNETGQDIEGVEVRVRLAYSPTNMAPRPVNALPIYMDVNLTVGGSNTFDVPPGRSEKAWEFTVPASGRLLGVGGHLHDHGVMVRLEDARTGRVLARVTAERSPEGKVTRISRQLFAVAGRGLRMVEGRRYRVVAVYDNGTGQTLVRGAMAHLAGLFWPDDLGAWPVLDLADESLQEDLAALNELGGHKHHEKTQGR